MAHDPGLYGLTAPMLTLLAGLVDRGAEVASHMDSGLQLSIEGEQFKVQAVGDMVRLVLSIGAFEGSPPVIQRLAVMPLHGHDREVVRWAHGLVVEASREFLATDADEAVEWLRTIARRYREILGEAESTYVNGNAYPDLVDCFAREGIGMPDVPTALRPRMRRHRETTRAGGGPADGVRGSA